DSHLHLHSFPTRRSSDLTLVTFGAPFKQREARMLMAEFPGFLQLQAGLLDPRLNLDRADIWKHLADDDLQHTIERSWWHNADFRSEEHTSELQSRFDLVC